MTPEQAKALRESATNIIAHEKRLESERTKLVTELERVRTSARQAVMMSEEAAREGDAGKVAGFDESAAVLADRIVELEAQLTTIDSELVAARLASEEAKSLASDSAIRMAQMKAEGAELRADLYRAAVAEATLEAEGTTPSFDEVKDTIGHRLAKAEAAAELSDIGGTAILDEHAAKVEEAAREALARAKLAEIRSQMGVTTPSDEAPSSDSGEEPEG